MRKKKEGKKERKKERKKEKQFSGGGARVEYFIRV